MMLHFVREIAVLLPGWWIASALFSPRREALQADERARRPRHISISPVSAEWVLEHERARGKDGE
jgi:hypothetical protein